MKSHINLLNDDDFDHYDDEDDIEIVNQRKL